MSEMKEFRGMDCKVVGIDSYVVHADRDIGITIHTYEYDEEIFCINKEEMLKDCKRLKKRGGNRLYHELFSRTIERIKEGNIPDFYYDDSGYDVKILESKYNFSSDLFEEYMSCPYK